MKNRFGGFFYFLSTYLENGVCKGDSPLPVVKEGVQER